MEHVDKRLETGHQINTGAAAPVNRPRWHTPALRIVTIDAVTSSYIRGGPRSDNFGSPGRTNNIS